jgi:hypothetical protein
MTDSLFSGSSPDLRETTPDATFNMLRSAWFKAPPTSTANFYNSIADVHHLEGQRSHIHLLSFSQHALVQVPEIVDGVEGRGVIRS